MRGCKFRHIFEGASFGVIFGGLFPVSATVITTFSREVEPTLGNLAAMYADEPLLQVIAAMPVVLGLAFGVVGRGRASREELIAGLEGRVAQRTAVLEAARKEVEQAAQDRGRLLTRVSETMCERIEQIVSTPRSERGQWAWESVKDVAMRLNDLARFEAGDLPTSAEQFEPQTLAEQIRAKLQSSPTIESSIAVNCEPGVPTKIEGNRALFEATVELAVHYAANLPGNGTTTVTLSPQRGVPGSAERMRIECRNEHASETSIRMLTSRQPEGSEVGDPLYDLMSVTLRAYAEALDAELVAKSSQDEGTTLTLLIPVVRVGDVVHVDSSSAAAPPEEPSAEAV